MIRILDKLFPFIAVMIVNHRISREIKQHESTKWDDKIKKSKLDIRILEKISHDIYQSQEQRISNIENKAISLIVALGFSISLLSMIVGFTDSEISIFRIVTLIVFIIAIFTLLLASISAILAYRIGERRVVTVNEFSKILNDNENNLLELVSEYLHAVEINAKIGMIKSNLVDVSQRHTIFGLILIFIATTVIVTESISLSIIIDYNEINANIMDIVKIIMKINHTNFIQLFQTS